MQIKSQNATQNDAQHFLVIQTAFIGDVILATPVIEKLHQHYPDAKIDMLVRKGNESLFVNHPFLHEILVLNKTDQKYRNIFRMIRSIRSRHYDHVINLHRFLSSGIIAVFSGGGCITGFDKNPLSRFYHHSVPHIIGGQESLHEVERNLSVIHHLTDPSFVRPKIYPPPLTNLHFKPPDRYICVAPASVWFTKQFPGSKWVDLLNRCPSDITIYLIGGPNDSDFCAQIERQTAHERVYNLSGELDLLNTATLMKHARMNFVNDSAPMHIASAVNAPVTVVYCSTVPAFGFRPLSGQSYMVETDQELPCRPCGLHGYDRCPEGHFKCAEIDVEQMIQSFNASNNVHS